MTSRRAGLVSLLVLLLGPAAARPEARAQAPGRSGAPGAFEAEAATSGDPVLARYLEALAARRLLAVETGSVDALREALRAGETLYFAGRYDEAALVLYEIVEGPRFADFAELDEYLGAELTLASSLAELGALRTASRYLLRLVARGPGDPLFGPAFRRYVDVALEGADLARAVAELEALEAEGLPEDAQNELRYLRARMRYDEGDLDAADAAFAEITRRSRFYTNALYLRGVIAARRGELEQAEAQFCRVAETPDRERFSFFIDDRYFEVKDLAWLGLGRVAHEGHRADDAFYYYFQVPNDSERVAEALFEAAYAMYEGNDVETAVDLLDQLDARFPRSPFAHEASLLRGYVHLSRCEFDLADRHFQAFLRRFEPVVGEIDRVLESPALKASLHARLLEAEAREARASAARASSRGAAPTLADAEASEAEASAGGETTAELLLALLHVDPTFYRLHADLRVLAAEAARAGRLSVDLDALAARLRGDEAPRAAADVEAYESEVAVLERDIARARDLLAGLRAELDALRRARAARDALRPLRAELRRHETTLASLERELRRLRATGADAEVAEAGGGDDLEAMLRSDALRARRLPRRVAQVQGHLEAQANAVAVASLRRLRETLAGYVRRARIGRIDAVMGSKRTLEIQIEGLAAGRFPPELVDPLRVQGLLRDDEEYWPFEGELWIDELEPTAPLGEDLP
jgi:outer membrane protein assembly factor BamD (BamD/ComL family)